MATRSRSESELVELFTGLVVESLSVKQDFGAATIGCRACNSEKPPLGVGDSVSVTLSCYEDFSWEIEGVYCPEHRVDSVAETMGIRAEQQAVLDAVLESAGYHPPRGNYEPDALTLGAVEIVDYSPTADGW